VALAVRALTPWEDESTRDADRELPVDARVSAIAQGLIVAALLVDGEPAFRSVTELGAFDETELRAMALAVFDGLAVVSPSYRRIDETAWSKRLEDGARHATNLSIVLAVGASSMDAGVGGPIFLPRFDRYFGLPFAEITDGQRMAYTAARKVYEGYLK
jgi:hypothetical protein